MQIALENLTAYQNYIRAYGQGFIQINNKTYTDSIVLAPTGDVMSWQPKIFAEFKVEHLAFIEQLKPQIILFGFGAKMQIPAPEIRLALQSYKVGSEFMDTAAACRTYNILLAEARNVVAALLIS